jgi:hypothetical protein
VVAQPVLRPGRGGHVGRHEHVDLTQPLADPFGANLAGAQQPVAHGVDPALGEELQPGPHGAVLLFLNQLVHGRVRESVLRRRAVDDRHVPAAHRYPVGEDEFSQEPAGDAQTDSPGVQPRLPGRVLMRDEVVLVC